MFLKVPLLHSLLVVAVLCPAGVSRTGGPAGEAPTPFEFTEVHMAMPVRIVLHASDTNTARAAARAAFDRIATLEGTMSDYRAQSEVRRLEERPGERIVVSAALCDVLTRAMTLARLTDGAFDPTVAPLVALWREARRTGRLPEAQVIDAARARVGWARVSLDSAACAVRLDAGMRLDLGGVAKGFILQEALAVLRGHGVGSALVEAGGDLVVGDAPPGRTGWRIEVPGASAAFAERAAALTHAALATSGPGAQFVLIGGVRYSHVVDPRTGWAVTSPRTAHVIAGDAALADALATALTVLEDHERGAVLARVEGVTAEVRQEASL